VQLPLWGCSDSIEKPPSLSSGKPLPHPGAARHITPDARTLPNPTSPKRLRLIGGLNVKTTDLFPEAQPHRASQPPGRDGELPPHPPTDPDVNNSLIRFLRHPYATRAGCLMAVCYTLSWSSVTGLVSSKSLPCFPQQNRMSGFAFPEVGPLSIGSPLSQPEFWPSVLCVAKTAVCPSRHTSLVAGVSIPCLLLCFVSRFRFLRGPGLGKPGDPIRHLTRRQMALPSS